MSYYALFFQKAKNATENQKKKERKKRKGEGTVTYQTCPTWFAKFCTGDFPLGNAPWLGEPIKVDGDQIKTSTENNQRYTM